MTSIANANPPDSAPVPSATRAPAIWKRIVSMMQFVMALALTVGFLIYLLFVPSATLPTEDGMARRPPTEVVEVIGPGLIRIQAGGPFDAKLTTVAVRKETIADPILTVTGRVAASLRPGNSSNNGADFWQFDSPEILTFHTDWQKSEADIAFAEAQLLQVKALAAARLEAQQAVVTRLEKLVAAGTDTIRDLTAEKANLIQTEITGRREVHDAETIVRVAKRSEAAAAKQLQQAGLDPELLRSATADIDVVLADVPEGRLHHIKVGLGCQATFFGIPKERFGGKVNSIAPVLSKERRSLRILFVINDPQDQLRPGMFAEIGLGTDPRDSLVAPTDGILHIRRNDYVLAATDAFTWRVVEVEVGEPRNGDVEILDGLKEGDVVIGKGAILLKPLVMQSLRFGSPAAKTDARP